MIIDEIAQKKGVFDFAKMQKEIEYQLCRAMMIPKYIIEGMAEKERLRMIKKVKDKSQREASKPV